MSQPFVIIARRTFDGPRARDYVLATPDKRHPQQFEAIADAEKVIRFLDRTPYTLSLAETARPSYRIEPTDPSKTAVACLPLL